MYKAEKEPNMLYDIFVDKLKKNKQKDSFASNICLIKIIQQCSDTDF